jgi:hypothetical protein
MATATTYDLTAGLKLDIEDMVHMLSPFDTPLLGTYNGSDRAGSALSSDTATEKKVEWLEDELLTPRSTVRVAYTSADLVVKVATGDGPKFGVDDVILVDAVYYRVTAVATDDLTVVVWSGSDANHSVGKDVIGVGSAPVEGADTGAARTRDRTQPYNITEIFGPYPVQISETEQVVRKYGVNSEWDYQVAARSKESGIGQEQALVYGQLVDDTANKRRSMRGILNHITSGNGSTIDSSTTDLAAAAGAGEAAFLAVLQGCFDKGGNPDTALANGTNKRKISGWNADRQRYTQDERVRGQVVDRYDSDFGPIYVVLDRWLRTADLPVFSREQATVVTLRPQTFVMLAKTGDSDKGHVVCERTLRFRRAKHAGKFTALT